jgi:hypothetical protein
MTAVVLVGDLPGTGVLQSSMAVRAPVRSRADYPAFIDLVGHGLRERSAVLVLCAAWRSAEALKAVSVARGALDSDRIAVLPLHLPPLALSLVADQIAFAAPYVKPGVLAGLADRLARGIHAGAWVNSVAKLEHVETAFSLHIKSYVPGGGFAVTAAPVQRVHRVSSGRPVPELAQRPADPVMMLISGADGDTGWVRTKLAPALAATSLTVVRPQPLSPAFWGVKKYVEYVAFSGHPQAMQATLASTDYRPCRWCGEATALPQCPFCCMVQPQAAPMPERPAPTDVRVAGPAPQPQPSPAVQHHVQTSQIRQSSGELKLSDGPGEPRAQHPPNSVTQKSWPYSASPSEAVIRSAGSDEAGQPDASEASPPRPRQPGTANLPAASEAANPDPSEERPDRSGSVSSPPARHR